MKFREYLEITNKFFDKKNEFNNKGFPIPIKMQKVHYYSQEEWEKLSLEKQESYVKKLYKYMSELKTVACPDISSFASLISAIDEAKKAALSSIQREDGGTCNLDYVRLYLEGNPFAIVMAIREGGLDASADRNTTPPSYWISVPEHQWQGFNREFQAKAIADVLEKHGFKAYYIPVMD